jgi:hypothetical protein
MSCKCKNKCNCGLPLPQPVDGQDAPTIQFFEVLPNGKLQITLSNGNIIQTNNAITLPNLPTVDYIAYILDHDLPSQGTFDITIPGGTLEDDGDTLEIDFLYIIGDTSSTLTLFAGANVLFERESLSPVIPSIGYANLKLTKNGTTTSFLNGISYTSGFAISPPPPQTNIHPVYPLTLDFVNDITLSFVGTPPVTVVASYVIKVIKRIP